MKRILTVLVVAALGAGALIACGGGSSNTTPNTPSTPSTDTAGAMPSTPSTDSAGAMPTGSAPTP